MGHQAVLDLSRVGCALLSAIFGSTRLERGVNRNGTLHDYLRDRLLSRVMTARIGDKRESLDELCRSEWSCDFERLMRNRLLMGRYRYGLMQRTDALQYDRVGSAMDRLRKYTEHGNTEHLVDVANLMLLEFEHGQHPRKHFMAQDDSRHVEYLGAES